MLRNHQLVARVGELSGLDEKEIAKACGYFGKASGRLNLPLFRKAIAMAAEPMSLCSVLTLCLSKGVEGCLGSSEHVLGKYPQLSHLYAEERLPWLKISMFFGRKSCGTEAILFVIFAHDHDQPILVSDDNALDAFLQEVRLSWASGPRASLRSLVPIMKRISCPPLQPSDTTTASIATSILAAAICTGHLSTASEADREEIWPMPAFDMFLPRGAGKVVASMRPCYNDFWDSQGLDQHIDADMLARLVNARAIYSAILYQSFAAEADFVQIGNWNEVIHCVEDLLCADSGGINGMEPSDSLNWHFLVDPENA